MYKSRQVFVLGLSLFGVFLVASILYKDQIFRIQSLLAYKGNYTIPTIGAPDFKASAASLKDVKNSTLGFQKVFVINLPERPDKLDQFSIISSLSGFTADVIEGVKGTDVKNKSLPALKGLPKTESARNNIVGCWRAHLNFAQTIVTNRLSSALVIEDDADWDVHLKDQLQQFAHGSQYMTGAYPNQRPHSPYGDDWDLLWLGHCASRPLPDDERRFVIENDATVPPPNRRVNFDRIPDMADEGYDNSTRIIYRAGSGCCTYAYALSYTGARKVLRAQALRTTFTPIDVAISQMCGPGSDFRCIGVFPQLVDSHKAAGRVSRDSDIGTFSADEFRERGYTWNIVHSIRLNMDRLISNEGAKIEMQWPDDPIVDGPPRLRAVARVLE